MINCDAELLPHRLDILLSSCRIEKHFNILGETVDMLRPLIYHLGIKQILRYYHIAGQPI